MGYLTSRRIHICSAVSRYCVATWTHTTVCQYCPVDPSYIIGHFCIDILKRTFLSTKVELLLVFFSVKVTCPQVLFPPLTTPARVCCPSSSTVRGPPLSPWSDSYTNYPPGFPHRTRARSLPSSTQLACPHCLTHVSGTGYNWHLATKWVFLHNLIKNVRAYKNWFSSLLI